MLIHTTQFKYNINEDFNSADKAEQLANHIFNDREEYEKDVQIQLERREQITELKTRIASLKELGATINYSKYTALSKKLAELEKIERSQPQISEYIRPIPLPSEYAEKPKPSNVNTPIPVFEIPNSNSSPVRQNSTNEIKSNTQAEDLKLPIGITVGALSLVTLFAIGLSNLPKSEKVAVITQPKVETQSEPIVEKEVAKAKTYEVQYNTSIEKDYPDNIGEFHYIISPQCDSEKLCDFLKVNEVPQTISVFEYHNGVKKIRVGSGGKNYKDIVSRLNSGSNGSAICSLSVNYLLDYMERYFGQVPMQYQSRYNHSCGEYINLDKLIQKNKD